MRDRRVLSMVGLTAMAACAAAVPGPSRPVAPRVAIVTPERTDVGSYWSDVSVSLSPGGKGPSLPAREPEVERALGASAAWASLPDANKQLALEDGFVASRLEAPERSLAAYYDSLDARHVPYVITLDALFSLSRACLGAALDEAERKVLAPALGHVVSSLVTRLGAERTSARVDLRLGYDTALVTLLVAASLLDPTQKPPSDLAGAVTFELAHVAAHAGVAESKALGRPLDYATFDVQQGLTEGDPRLGSFRAVRWLGQAALVIARRSEGTRGVDVAEMRTQTRAALLITRALRSDAALSAEWSRALDLMTVLYGPADDLGVRELARLAKGSGVDLADGLSLVNVTTIDRVRRAAVNSAPAFVADLGALPALDREEAPATFRVLGPSATPDAIVLGRMVAPRVGAWHGAEPHAAQRSLASALDVGVLLGSRDARAALAESGEDGYAGFSEALTAATTGRFPDDASSHVSVFLSYLDAIRTYVGPSAADVTQPQDSALAGRRKLVVALSAWAGLRHEGVPFAHEVGTAHATGPWSDVVRAPSMVEPHPEAIAKLLGTMRQLDAALLASNAYGPDSVAKQSLTLVIALLGDALEAAAQETSCSPPNAIPWPKRFGAIEALLGIEAASPRVAVVAIDALGRVLEEGTGALEQGLFLLRPPEATAHASVYLGAHVPHLEATSTLRANDRAWSTESARARPTWSAGLYAKP